MKNRFKIALIILTGLLLLLILLSILLPSIIDLTKYKGKTEDFIAESLDRDVSISEIRLSVLKGIGAELRDIKIGNDPDLIDIEEMRIKVSLLPLFQGRIEMRGIHLRDTKIFLKKDSTRKISISHLYIPLTSYRGGLLEFKGVKADLYKGIFLGDLKIEKREKASLYSLIHNIENVEVEPLIKDVLSSKVTISGPLRLGGTLKVVGAYGHSPLQLERLEGSGSLNIGKGKVKGLELIEMIGSIGKVTSKKPISSITDYDSISGHYTIRGGYLRTEDLEMVGDDIYLRAKGSYGLTNSKLDFIIKGGIIDIPIEIKIGGTISSPTYNIKPPAVVKKALEELGKELTKGKNKEKGVEEVLKGLFKK